MRNLLLIAPKIDGALAVLALLAALYCAFHRDWATGAFWLMSALISGIAWKYRPLQLLAIKIISGKKSTPKGDSKCTP
ncbi:hypothetical protein [Acidovorax sp.]|uniref:hypothetical protein n=1 Tax=Acidovorax sp. TaxID=1872122 RepID=UPI00391FBAA3